MTAALKSAVDRQEWIAVTLWEPSWMVQKFDVKYLQDPKGVFPPPQTYYWIGQEGFSEEYPHAREVMASVYVPIADITAINAEVSDGKSMDQAVADWIAEPRRPDRAVGKHQEGLTRLAGSAVPQPRSAGRHCSEGLSWNRAKAIARRPQAGR